MRLIWVILLIIFWQLNTLAQTTLCDSLFTDNELAWLKKNKENIKYAPNYSWAPADFVNEYGIHQGIISDYIKIFEYDLNLKFQRIYIKRWSELKEGLKNAEIDFGGAIQRTEERDKYLNFTDPFLTVPIVILVKNSYSTQITEKQINNMRLACVKGYSSLEYVKEKYPNAKIIECETDLSAILLTSLGKTDGTVTDLISATYIIEKYGINNLDLGTELDYVWNLRFACRKGQQELCSILNKLLKTIDTEKRREIFNKWVPIGKIEEKKIFEKNWRIILFISGILLLALVTITGVNLTLRKLVKHRTFELLAAKEMAEESDRLKSAFLANLSHEIRTPMNAIMGFTGLLQKPDLSSERQDDFIKIIKKSGEYLLSVITDIIEVSKLDTGQVYLSFSEFDINNFASLIYESMLVNMPENKKIKFEIKKSNIPENTIIKTDDVKLKQIILNLITNAFKYTLEGNVVFKYNFKGNTYLEIVVTDTGIGIPEKYHEIIFERFRQVDIETKIFQQGSGLGLSICKAYSEMLGGTISVESEPDVGSIFTVSIPIKIVSEISINEELDSIKDIRSEGKKILIAEDDEINYIYINEILGDRNFNLYHAYNGIEVIKILKEIPAISLILMDIKMPIMNGYETLKEIRNLNYDIPVIAQSAYALSEDIKNIKSAGFDAYISKPINKEKLIELIEQSI